MDDYTKLSDHELLTACGSDAQKWAKAFMQHIKSYGITCEGGYVIDEGAMTSWFANAIMRSLDERSWRDAKKLSGSEAVVGFVAWLTTRPEITKMGASENCSPLVDLISQFCEANNLDHPRPDYHHNLVHPPEMAKSAGEN